MTTSEALDLLAQLSQKLDPKAAQDRAIQREFGRSPLINFTATIFIDPEAPTTEVVQNPTGNSWTERHLAVHLKDAEVLKHDNYNWSEESEYTITMKVPDDGYDARPDDEAVLFMAGLQALIPGANLANINGTRIQFEERHKEYTFKRKKNNYIDETATRWWYEAVKVVGQAKSAAPVATKPSDAAIQRALDTIKAAGDAGIVETEFNVAATKGNADKADDRAMMKYLTENTLLKDHPSSVLRDADKLVWVGGE